MPLQNLCSLLTNTSKTIIKGIISFKKAFLLFFLVFLISLIILFFAHFSPMVTLELADSRATPWGIVTSIFTHLNFEHLASNMIGLFIWIFLFAFTNSTFKQEINRKAEKFFIVSTVLSAITSNIIWLLLTPASAVGASGLVYATLGALLGFTFFNGVQVINFSKFKLQPFAVGYMILVNLLIFCLLLLYLFTSPVSFLSIGEGVNAYAHGLSFYFAFVAISFWYLVYARKHSVLVHGKNRSKD